jgi:hypothetical protein
MKMGQKLNNKIDKSKTQFFIKISQIKIMNKKNNYQ